MSDLISREQALHAISIDNLHPGIVSALQSIIEELPSIDAVPVQDGILKARKGDYVTYRIDYLLDHLAQEISLLEGYRRGRKEE